MRLLPTKRRRLLFIEGVNRHHHNIILLRKGDLVQFSKSSVPRSFSLTVAVSLRWAVVVVTRACSRSLPLVGWPDSESSARWDSNCRHEYHCSLHPQDTVGRGTRDSPARTEAGVQALDAAFAVDVVSACSLAWWRWPRASEYSDQCPCPLCLCCGGLALPLLLLLYSRAPQAALVCRARWWTGSLAHPREW